MTNKSSCLYKLVRKDVFILGLNSNSLLKPPSKIGEKDVGVAIDDADWQEAWTHLHCIDLYILPI